MNFRFVCSCLLAALMSVASSGTAWAQGGSTAASIIGTVSDASGAVIPGITDGFSGANPDIGAVISGRTAPVVGDLHDRTLHTAPGHHARDLAAIVDRHLDAPTMRCPLLRINR